MQITDFFDRVFIISLRSRTDRRREMRRELLKHGIPLQPGKVEFFDAIRPESLGGFESIGYHGCYLSHLGVLKRARELGLSNVLIMEDDLKFTPAFKRYRDDLVRSLRGTTSDITYLGHPVDLPTPSKGFELVSYNKPFTLLHCYAVNASIFDRLIDFLEAILTRPAGHPDGGPMSLDGAVSIFRMQNPDVVTLLANPNLAVQCASRSDLRDGRWFDQTPGFREMASFARCVLNRVRG